MTLQAQDVFLLLDYFGYTSDTNFSKWRPTIARRTNLKKIKITNKNNRLWKNMSKQKQNRTANKD